MDRLKQGKFEHLNEVFEGFCEMADSCKLLKVVFKENDELKADNERLREIFEFGTFEFEKKNRYIIKLEQNLQDLKTYASELEEENKLLKEELEKEKANDRLLQKMLFSKGVKKQVEQPSETEKQEEVEYE